MLALPQFPVSTTLVGNSRQLFFNANKMLRNNVTQVSSEMRKFLLVFMQFYFIAVVAANSTALATFRVNGDNDYPEFIQLTCSDKDESCVDFPQHFNLTSMIGQLLQANNVTLLNTTLPISWATYKNGYYCQTEVPCNYEHRIFSFSSSVVLNGLFFGGSNATAVIANMLSALDSICDTDVPTAWAQGGAMLGMMAGFFALLFVMAYLYYLSRKYCNSDDTQQLSVFPSLSTNQATQSVGLVSKLTGGATYCKDSLSYCLGRLLWKNPVDRRQFVEIPDSSVQTPASTAAATDIDSDDDNDDLSASMKLRRVQAQRR